MMYCDIRNEEKLNNDYCNACRKASQICSFLCLIRTTETLPDLANLHSAVIAVIGLQKEIPEVPFTLLRVDEPLKPFWKHHFKVKSV